MRKNTVSSANNLTVLRPNENGSTLSQSTDGYGDEHGSSETAVDCEPCSSFIRCIVKVKDLEYMNSYWLPGTHDELRNWKGFRHRLVITPPANPQRSKDDDLEFVVILYFLGINNLRAWSTSTEVSSTIIKFDCELTIILLFE